MIPLVHEGLVELSPPAATRGKPALDARHPEATAKVWNSIELEQFAERRRSGSR
jgi:hypothetical protein